MTSKTSSRRFIITSHEDGKTGEREGSQAAVPKQEGLTRSGFAVRNTEHDFAGSQQLLADR